MAAAGEAVQLLGAWASTFALRARIALNINGVEYEFLEETKLPEKSELLLKSNPVYKKIPVLIHGDKPVCESMVIVEYVDNAWPPIPGRAAILPAYPYDRALHRFWAAYIDDKLAPLQYTIAQAETDTARAEAVQQMLAGLELLEGAFEGLIKGNGFFGGGDIGYLDIALGCSLAWFRVLSKMIGVEFLDRARTPLLAAWAERFCAHEAVEGVMPVVGKLMEFAQERGAKLRAAK